MKLYGIFGFPLKHTLSPKMQEAAFAKLGIDASYLPLELDPPHFKRMARRLSGIVLSGFNVTVPYKETILPYLDVLSKEVELIGAVNTVKKVGRKTWGYNTDWQGFCRALEHAKFKVRGKNAVILGAGGAARSCVYGLMRSGAERIVIFNRHPEKAKKIQKDFRRKFKDLKLEIYPLNNEYLKEELAKADFLINTTSVGLRKEDPVLVKPEMFHSKLAVYDTIYNPAMTPLLEMGRKKKCRVENGLTMLLYQGARAFEIWTGKKAPEKIMFEALKKGLEIQK